MASESPTTGDSTKAKVCVGGSVCPSRATLCLVSASYSRFSPAHSPSSWLELAFKALLCFFIITLYSRACLLLPLTSTWRCKLVGWIHCKWWIIYPTSMAHLVPDLSDQHLTGSCEPNHRQSLYNHKALARCSLEISTCGNSLLAFAMLWWSCRQDSLMCITGLPQARSIMRRAGESRRGCGASTAAG
ncbi:hypothetical protein PoB_003847200 [Plakobranchus ocellatus]|uniref:Uncharacterized protein n=1 Tax=Plakobranchus ocellatus TaxID=259542 RepID=A0AAV4AY23_9GAST|nr:hypothetical protein PoB_003847200 [Plakobranchus ocellatus]